MPPEARACIDGIPPGHRPLFERLHRLILTAHPGAQVTLSYKMPACEAGNRRLYVGAWNRGILVCGWQKDRDGGFTSRRPELVTSKGTLQLRDGDAAGISAFAGSPTVAVGQPKHPHLPREACSNR